jgi:hypothetical protein
MKSHFGREGFWMTVFLFLGPIMIGLGTTIIVQAVRGARSQRAVHAVQSSASSVRP